MARLYRYVGPEETRERAGGSAAGVEIATAGALRSFVEALGGPGRRGSTPLTFVVGERGELRVAVRGAEHVACAGPGEAGAPARVRAAGELLVRTEGDAGTHVEGASNQSTGYCPEPESFAALAAALDAAGIGHPGRYTEPIVFRRCPSCGERNLVKEGWFVCALCDAELPATWNF
ncbi:MAG: hypothetical protein HOO96_10255 [Polyangiaceae bacterium]|nr:hypothetical protein [Polyangiaceae bacterium]